MTDAVRDAISTLKARVPHAPAGEPDLNRLVLVIEAGIADADRARELETLRANNAEMQRMERERELALEADLLPNRLRAAEGVEADRWRPKCETMERILRDFCAACELDNQHTHLVTAARKALA